MSTWPSSKAKRVYQALLHIGWRVKKTKPGSHVQLERSGFPDFTWAFHPNAEVGPKMLSRIAKHTGLKPNDLSSA